MPKHKKEIEKLQNKYHIHVHAYDMQLVYNTMMGKQNTHTHKIMIKETKNTFG